jgi:hypothetical protein
VILNQPKRVLDIFLIHEVKNLTANNDIEVMSFQVRLCAKSLHGHVVVWVEKWPISCGVFYSWASVI